MADVFISYSRKDKDFVKILYEAITESHYDAWVDWEDIPLTADWWEEIKTGIEAANTFIFIISPDSIISKVCGQEIDYAVTNNKRLIPIVRRDGFDMTLVHPSLGKRNWLFFRDIDDFDQAFQALVKTLDTDLDHVQQHTRLLVKAIEWDKKSHTSDLLLRGGELETCIQWITQSADKEPRSTQLQREYINESRKIEIAEQQAELKRQKKARRAITVALFATIGGLVISTGLGLVAYWQYQEAKLNEIKALSTSSKALFALNQELDALMEALRAANRLESVFWAPDNVRNQVRLSLQQAVYGIQERNRLEIADPNRQGFNSVDFSPKGEVVVTTSCDSTLRFWKLNGQEFKTVREGNGNSCIGHVRFSPEGKYIAAGVGNQIKLWNSQGKEVRILEGHTDFVNDVSFSPESRIIASASRDGTVKLWTLDGKLLQSIEANKFENAILPGVLSVSFSPDGKILAATSGFIVRLWQVDGSSLKEIKTFVAHENNVNSLAFSPDGKTFVTASYDRTLKIWSANGQELQHLQSHNSSVSIARFSPDGKTIASGSQDKTIKLWNLQGQELATLKGHTDGISDLTFSQDGKTLASASNDGTVRLWSLAGQELKTFVGHTYFVYGLSFSPDGKTIVSGSVDKTIRLWNILDGKELKQWEGHDNSVWNVSFSPDGQVIASGSPDETVRLWDLAGRQVEVFNEYSPGLGNIDFSPTGKMIAFSSIENTFQLWSLNRKELRIFEGHQGSVESIRFSPDGNMIASGSDDHTIKLWSVDGREIRTLTGHTDGVTSVAFNPDGKTLASASRDKTLRLWKITGEQIWAFRGNSSTLNVQFSPNGKIIASASRDGIIQFFDLTGQEIKTLKAHSDSINNIRFSPDGNVLASVSDDNTIKFWSTETLGFDQLLGQGCKWVQDYLINSSQVSESDRRICDVEKLTSR